MSDSAADRYVMGHTNHERRRLQLQAAIINPITEQLFQRSGISAGMHVLDVGSGVGDVALIAARLVGPTGAVTACDLDAAALSVLAARAEAEGLRNITTVTGDINELGLPSHFDVVTGRHILIHLPDPKRFLASALELLRPGGLVVFQEFDFSVRHASHPPTPLRDELLRIFERLFALAGRGNIGTQLPALFVALGLADIDARAEYVIDTGGPASRYHEWFADSMRSVLPRAQAAGVAGELDIDTLETRLREEALAAGSVLPSAAMVGVTARKPRTT